ncbi:MAG TPA: hypothetical protein H9815_12945 [Candidatus Ruania gallistercoris]|uniref:Uncharacterized protein n=1 Tax=Candidatus Ruania gallistercoris TaxID=2838746 RepID=A0A9D2EFV7_9MICO|nr:hypothetical protein [Candidatus Ruania gallistercoris]
MRTARRDSTALLNTAALRAQLNTTLLANEILLATSPEDDLTLSFARCIPGSTDQGTTALLSERDLTRELLRDAGVMVGDFASFAFKSDRGAALEWADQIGYPVAVSPAWMVHIRPPALNAEMLGSEIERIARMTATRSLGPSHPRGRYLVEKVTGGHRIELGIAHGEVLYRLVDGEVVDGTRVHPGLEERARQAVTHIPGLSVARVWLTAEDPAQPPDGQLCRTLDVSPRATFDDLLRLDPAAAERAALRLMHGEADAQGLSITGQSAHSGAVLTIGGVALPERAADQIAEFCTDRLPDLSVRSTPSAEILVESPGDAGDIDTLQRTLMYGLLEGVRPLYVSAEWRP